MMLPKLYRPMLLIALLAISNASISHEVIPEGYWIVDQKKIKFCFVTASSETVCSVMPVEEIMEQISPDFYEGPSIEIDKGVVG